MNIRREKKILFVVVGLIVLVPILWFFFWRNVDVQIEGEPLPQEESEEIEDVVHEAMPSSANILATGTFEPIERVVSGKVNVMKSDDKYFVRLEDFITEDCEHCFVYFSDNDELDGLMNLGDLKARVGDMNYQVPEDVLVRPFEEVLIWDERAEKIVARAVLMWTDV